MVSGCQASPQDDLINASASCELPKIKAAIAAGATVNPRSPSDEYPLFMAAGNGCLDVVHALIAAGADVNAVADHVSALEEGAGSGDPQVVRALIAAGAKVNARERFGNSVLVQTVYNGKVAAVQALIAGGAEVNSKDEGGQTALFTASQYGRPEMAQLLISAGADVNARDSFGKTALSVAISPASSRFGTAKGHSDVAAILRAHGGHE
jgi:ankyrin repeat protein